MTSLLRSALLVVALVLTGLAPQLYGQAPVTTVSRTVPTGFDVSLDSRASGYSLSLNPRLWYDFQPGGFVEYTVSAQAGTYALQLYYATMQAGPLGVSVNGVMQSPTYVPNSGSWNSFQMSPPTTVTLPAGRSVLRLFALPSFTPFNLAGMLLSPVAMAASAPEAESVGAYPLKGEKFFVSPYSESAQNVGLSCGSEYPNAPGLISKLAGQAQGVWFGNWNTDPGHDVAGVMEAASAQQAVPILIAYNIPSRDCGGDSGAGRTSADEYESWINSFASGIGDKKAVVILEPDALSQLNNSGCLNKARRAERLQLMNYAVKALQQNAPKAAVYLDAGHDQQNGNGISAPDMAQRLTEAGVANAAGFALNVSNYDTTESNATYGQQISKLIGNKHFVIDTSRNGRGPDTNFDWCNPPERGAGTPSQGFGTGLIDGYVWAQNPGSSDGACKGAPSAGVFSAPIACTLAANASF